MRPARSLSAFLLAACLVASAGPVLRAGEGARASAEAHVEYLDDLCVILEETKSPDAFMITLRCLDDDKADPRMLIPLAIRNAERLGILGDHAGKDGRKVDRAANFAELLELIHKRMPQADTSPKVKPQKQRVAANDSSTQFAEDPRSECDDAPEESSVLAKLAPPPRCLQGVCEISRDDVQVVYELMKDEAGEPGFFPLVGPARLHHCHWKCTVFYKETIQGQWPFAFRCTRPRVQVVYLDRDSLHVEGETDKPHGCSAH